MYDVVTFGEAMVRLSSPEYRRLVNATKLDVEVGGGEYNVAVGCAHLGLKSAWVSRLVDNWTGWIIRNKGREHGVDMSHVVWVDFDGVGLVRNGFYHMEVGVGPRASAVTYDRGHSAISQIEPGMVDWKAVLEGTRWFHVSGITPALSDGASATTLEALKAAADAGVTTSYDLNFRSKLWSPEKAQETTAQISKKSQIRRDVSGMATGTIRAPCATSTAIAASCAALTWASTSAPANRGSTPMR